MQAFRAYDLNKSGTIDASEFRSVLVRYNLFLNDYEFHKLLARIANNKPNKPNKPNTKAKRAGHLGSVKEVSYRDFVEYFGKEMFGSREPSGGTNEIGKEKPADLGRVRANPTIGYEEARRSLRQKLADHYKECSTAFRSYDLNKSGTIEYGEFMELLVRLNIYLKHLERDGRRMFTAIDANGNGAISYPEFVQHFGECTTTSFSSLSCLPRFLTPCRFLLRNGVQPR